MKLASVPHDQYPLTFVQKHFEKHYMEISRCNIIFMGKRELLLLEILVPQKHYGISCGLLANPTVRSVWSTLVLLVIANLFYCGL